MKKSASTISGVTTPKKAKVPSIKLKSLNSQTQNSSRNSVKPPIESLKSSFSSRSSIISIAESDQMSAMNTSTMGSSDNAVFIKFKIKILKVDLITNDPIQLQMKLVDSANTHMAVTSQRIIVDKTNPSAKFNETFTVVLYLNKQLSTKSSGDMYSYKYFEKRLQFKAQYQKKNSSTIKSFAFGSLDMSQYVVATETVIKQPFKKYGIKNIEGKTIFTIQATSTDQTEQSIQNTTDDVSTSFVSASARNKDSMISTQSPFAPKGDDHIEYDDNESVSPVKTQLIDLDSVDPKSNKKVEQKSDLQQQQNSLDPQKNVEVQSIKLAQSIKESDKDTLNTRLDQINLSMAETQRKSTLTTTEKLTVSSGAKTMTNRDKMRSSYAFEGSSSVPHSAVDLQSEEDDQQLLQQLSAQNDPNKLEELRQQRIKFLNSHCSQSTKNQTSRSMNKSDSKSNKSGKSGNRVSFNMQFSASQQQVENDQVYIQLIEECMKSMNEEVIWLQQQNKQQKDKLINFQLQEESFNEMKSQQANFIKVGEQKEELERAVEQLEKDLQEANEIINQQDQSIMDLETQLNDQKMQLRSVAMMQDDASSVIDDQEEPVQEDTNDITVLKKQLESYKQENQKLKNLAGSYEVQLVNTKRQLAQVMNDIIQQEKTSQPSTPRQRINFLWP